MFPAQKDLVVEHRYSPFVGGNVGFLSNVAFLNDRKLSGQILSEYKTRYCTDNDFLAAVQRTKKAGGADRTIPETQLEYVLATGANWAGPIKDFRLVVDKGEPDSLVSFCATGVKKIGPNAI